jgi:hypothetical protein
MEVIEVQNKTMIVIKKDLHKHDLTREEFPTLYRIGIGSSDLKKCRWLGNRLFINSFGKRINSQKTIFGFYFEGIENGFFKMSEVGYVAFSFDNKMFSFAKNLNDAINGTYQNV